MLFEIKITDPMGNTILNDIFFMDSIMDVMDIATDTIVHGTGYTDEKAFRLTILSEKECHIDCRFADLSAAMVFKNMLYDRLIELNSPLASRETDLELAYKSNESL
ncbi:hypothetical protein [Costertonia aggregata]|uniref:Uncharacterized protein n=1 Tax=Costertonia aggregata TaxID=343403 RepID=A0A7H9AT63_9FLAO|nr:hypothetical protein [Costertonia aggregata]QLG46597.1 hypothetical protein HYG79_14980 [Costertonia aggregata]